MSEREVELTSEREPIRQACGDAWGDLSCTLLEGHDGMHIDERVFGEVKPSYADLAARLADAEARAEAAEAKVARVEALADELAHPDTDLIVAYERAVHRNIAHDLREVLRGDQ